MRNKKFTWLEPSLLNIPPIREHRAIAYKDSIYIFGGSKNPSSMEPKSRFYEYNCITREFKELNIPKTPCLRTGHAMTCANDSLFVCGGYNGVKMMDLFEFHIPSKTWRPLIPTTNQKPSPRSYHTLCAFKNELLLFGGETKNGVVNELWVYDCLKGNWTKIEPSGDEQPSPRRGHTAVVCGYFMYILGGTHCEDTFYELNCITKKWKRLKPEFPLGPVYYHTADVHKDMILVYGGCTRNRSIDALVQFDTRKKTWSKVQTRGIRPTSTYFHSMNIVGDNMYVCGGCPTNGKNAILYQLKLETMVTLKITPKSDALANVILYFKD